MSSSYEVLVIGGGPIGAATAREAARAGARVGLIERRANIANPAACAGLVSPRTLETLGASPRCVLRTIHALNAISPNGTVLSLRSANPKAVVVDRSALEQDLLEQAAAAGVAVHRNVTATAVTPGAVTLDHGGTEDVVAAAVVVGADGPRSSVARWLGLSPAPQVLPAAQAVVACDGSSAEDTVTVFVGASYTPGFFAWSVPAEPGHCRVGLATTDESGPVPFLTRLLSSHYPGHRVVGYTHGSIPIGAAPRIANGAGILVGDAAGHVKPLSGGGLYFGALCARIVGSAAAIAARTGDTRTLRSCEADCDKAIGEEIRFGRFARSVLIRLPDTRVDDLFRVLNRSHVLDVLADNADIDYPSRLLQEIGRKPRVWARLLPLVSLLDPTSKS